VFNQAFTVIKIAAGLSNGPIISHFVGTNRATTALYWRRLNQRVENRVSGCGR
jgi:hypothetical protein